MKKKIFSATTVVLCGAVIMVGSAVWGALASGFGWSYWLSWVAWFIGGAFVLMHARPFFDEVTRWSRR